MNFIKGLFSRKISSDEVSFMAEHFSIYAVGVPMWRPISSMMDLLERMLRSSIVPPRS